MWKFCKCYWEFRFKKRFDNLQLNRNLCIYDIKFNIRFHSRIIYIFHRTKDSKIKNNNNLYSLALLGKQKASEWFKDEQYHVGIVNIWRPLESPVEKSPLGHIDISTLKPEDWKKIKVIYKDRVGVMRGLVHNE